MTPADTPRYRIEHKLGAGGTGVVYRATDTQLERTVALKVLEVAPGEEARAAMVREARAASALNHPSICTVYEVTTIDGQPSIVMEYVDGTSLAKAVPPGGLAPELVVRYGVQIASALAHAHDRGVLHRDLSSANVMITREGHAKVLDFGLARRVREWQRDIGTEDMDSPVGEEPLRGTLVYMSPDVLEGHPPRPADDLWSLGVMLYEIATGALPFRGATRFQLASSIQRDAPAALPPRVSFGLRSVILRCLARDSAVRYQQAHEVRAALEALQGEFGTAPAPVAAKPLLRTAGVAIVALLLIALVGAFAWLKRGDAPRPFNPATPASAPISIAVLPLANPTHDPQLEYLTDGIAETVISSLARVPGKVTVIAWSAVQQYRQPQVDAQEVGRELGVGTVLQGAIVRANDGLAVSVELVDASDRRRLWSETYKVQVANLLNVHEEIATRIASALRLQLSGDEQRALRSQYPANPEAYHLYIQGQYHLYRFTPDSYRRGLDFFQQAIQRDPTYALAHAGVARALSNMTYEGLLPPATFTEVERAATTALSLDPTLGAAHDALAHLKFAYEWDWNAAEREFKTALALSPRDAAIHQYFGIFLRTQRRWADAIAQMKEALALNPVSVEATKALGTTYYWAGQNDRAIEQLTRALTLDPTHSQTLDLLADVFAAKGLYVQALDTRRRYLETAGAFEAAEALGTDGSEAGYRRGMRRLYRQYLARLEEEATDRNTYISPMEFAFTYIAIGDTDRAFAALEQAFSQRAPWLASLAADPAFDPLRSDPRFASLAARVGVPIGRS